MEQFLAILGLLASFGCLFSLWLWHYLMKGTEDQGDYDAGN